MKVEVDNVEWRITTIGEFVTSINTVKEGCIDVFVYKAQDFEEHHWTASINARTVALESFDIMSAMGEALTIARGV